MAKRFLSLALVLAATACCWAQAPVSPVDVRTSEQLRKQAAEMLLKAQKNPAGVDSVTLEKYGNHYTMLTVRTKDGGAELHKHADDFFIVLEGEATVVTGGTLAGEKQVSDGELRGSKVEGGTKHILRKGDVMHISPNVPHQALVAPGRTFIYYVIKVVE